MFVKIWVTYSEQWYPGWRPNSRRIRFFIDEDELAKVRSPDLGWGSRPIDYKTNGIIAFNAKSLKGCVFSGCWCASSGELVADRVVESDVKIKPSDVMDKAKVFPELGERELDI